MASSMLSKPCPSRPLLPRPSASASPLHRFCCLSLTSSRRCLFLSCHLSSSHCIGSPCLWRDFGLLSSASVPSSSQGSFPVTACDSNLRGGLDSNGDAGGQNQFFRNVLNPEPRLDRSLNALQGQTLDRSSVGEAESATTLSFGQNGNATSADGFSVREPTEYDFEIYASNSMEGFEQPPPPLPRFGAVFEDYWGEVIGEDTRPKGDEASIRIRNGLLKYLESLKEAEAKENKTKPRPLFSGSRGNNQPKPIQSYSSYLASKESAGGTLPGSSSDLTSGRSEDAKITDSDPGGAEKPPEKAAVSVEGKLSDAKPAEGKIISGDSELLGPLPTSRADDSKPAERSTMPGNRNPSNLPDVDAFAEVNSTQRKPILGDSVSLGTSPGYGVRDDERPGRENMFGRSNFRSPTEADGARDTIRVQRDTSFGRSNLSNSVPPAARARDDGNSAFSRNRPIDSNRPKDFDKGEAYEVIGRLVTPGLANTFVGGRRVTLPDAKDVGSTLDAETVDNASTNKPENRLAGRNSSLDSKPLERAADSNRLEDRWSDDRVGEFKPAGKPVEDRWPGDRFGYVKPADKPVEDRWSSDRFGDVKPAVKPVEDRWSGDRFGDVKPAGKPVEDRWSGDRVGDVKPADKPVEDRWSGDRFRDLKPSGKPMEDRWSGDRFGDVKPSGKPIEDRWTGDSFENVKPASNTGAGNSMDSSFRKSSLSESRSLETVSNMIPKPLESVVDSKGVESLTSPNQVEVEVNSVSTASVVDSKGVDSSMSFKPRELEVNSVSTPNTSGSPMMQADPPVSANVPDGSMEAVRYSSEEDTVSYVPRVRDTVLGAVISGSDDEKLELEIGAEQPGLMLSKDLRPFLETNLENCFFELPSIDESQKLEGFVAPLGKSLIVEDKVAYNGASSISSIVDFGTVVTAEVQALTLGDGRAILSARPPARRMAWHRIKQLMQLGDTISIQIVQYNEGGVLGFLEGLRSFLPRSELLRRPENTAALSEYIGRTLPVVILQAEEEMGNIIISEFTAWKRKNLQLGTVHDATVTRVYSYGMQVEVNNTRVRGFVHISNMSKEFVKRVADLFTEGEKVKVMLIRGRDAHQVSFSIGEFESDRGLIFRDKERVFREAEEMAMQFRENLSADDRQVFGQAVQDVELELECPVIANMNWLHLGNEI